VSDALELADWLARIGHRNEPAGSGRPCRYYAAAAELRRQHAIIEALAKVPSEITFPEIFADRPNWPRGEGDVDVALRIVRERIAAVIESGGAS
jgi:hypothetical protein